MRNKLSTAAVSEDVIMNIEVENWRVGQICVCTVQSRFSDIKFSDNL